MDLLLAGREMREPVFAGHLTGRHGAGPHEELWPEARRDVALALAQHSYGLNQLACVRAFQEIAAHAALQGSIDLLLVGASRRQSKSRSSDAAEGSIPRRPCFDRGYPHRARPRPAGSLERSLARPRLRCLARRHRYPVGRSVPGQPRRDKAGVCPQHRHEFHLSWSPPDPITSRRKGAELSLALSLFHQALAPW